MQPRGGAIGRVFIPVNCIYQLSTYQVTMKYGPRLVKMWQKCIIFEVDQSINSYYYEAFYIPGTNWMKRSQDGGPAEESDAERKIIF